MTRNEVRQKNEKRGDDTARNLRNRARKKQREYWGKPYPGVGKAAWPAGVRKENKV